MATTTRGRTYTAPKPRNDAYTGLLFISFLALVTSSILLFLDYNQYGAAKPTKFSPPAVGAPPAVPAPPVDAGTGAAPGEPK